MMPLPYNATSRRGDKAKPLVTALLARI